MEGFKKRFLVALSTTAGLAGAASGGVVYGVVAASVFGGIALLAYWAVDGEL